MRRATGAFAVVAGGLSLILCVLAVRAGREGRAVSAAPAQASGATGAPLGFGEQGFEDLPLRITHICGIVTFGAHRQDSLPWLCVEVGV